MGADNISFTAVYPAEIKQRDINKVRKYLLEVKRFLENLSDEQTQQLENVNFEDLAGIKNLVDGICLVNGFRFSKETRGRIALAVQDCAIQGETPTYPEELDNDPPYGQSYRDSSYRTVKLGKATWMIVTAGEMTWGDEPQGLGYQELKQAYRWGVIPMLGGQ